MNIYVGNLPHTATEEAIRNLFSAHGAVDSVRIMTDKFTGQPRGFCFVSMPSNDEANNAIQSLNDIEFEGSRIRVNEARPPRQGGNGGAPRGGNGGGYGRSSGGYGRSSGGNGGGFGGRRSNDRYSGGF